MNPAFLQFYNEWVTAGGSGNVDDFVQHYIATQGGPPNPADLAGLRAQLGGGAQPGPYGAGFDWYNLGYSQEAIERRLRELEIPSLEEQRRQFNEQLAFQKAQQAATLKANPRNYVEYFQFLNKDVPVPQYLQNIGAATGEGGLPQFQPGQITPRMTRYWTPSQQDVLRSFISAGGESPEDFEARAKRFFPFGRLAPSARYNIY